MLECRGWAWTCVNENEDNPRDGKRWAVVKQAIYVESLPKRCRRGPPCRCVGQVGLPIPTPHPITHLIGGATALHWGSLMTSEMGDTDGYLGFPESWIQLQ